jgi:hypothetical protein
MYKIWLEGEVAVSWNKYHGRSHWAKRKSHSDNVHALMMAAIHDQMNGIMIESPVYISITATRKRPLDPDNICAKPYIDGLRRALVIQDDTYKHIHSVTVKSRKPDRDEDIGVLIEIWEA